MSEVICGVVFTRWRLWRFVKKGEDVIMKVLGVS